MMILVESGPSMSLMFKSLATWIVVLIRGCILFEEVLAYPRSLSSRKLACIYYVIEVSGLQPWCSSSKKIFQLILLPSKFFLIAETREEFTK